MNILMLLAHSIAEYDDCRMFTDMGHSVFSIGAYTTPWTPSDDKRPPLESMSYLPEFERLVPDQMAAKANLPDAIIEWADVIICHHYLDKWIIPQWDRIKHKRVIWRTCGQSDPRLEHLMTPLHDAGLTIVRYSPVEEPHFRNAGAFAGQDAMIRFGKYVDDYAGTWEPSFVHDSRWVGNVTQDMAGRGDWCGLSYWLAATKKLEAHPAGPNSQALPGGIGPLDYEQMLSYLRQTGVYLYTGTVPAPYTLGLIEAMLTGTPLVGIGPGAWTGPRGLFEGHRLIPLSFDYPDQAAGVMADIIKDIDYARQVGDMGRQMARELFDVEPIKAQWAAVLE